MMHSPGILKRTYDIVALFALANVLALGGLAVYLVGSGAVSGEELREIAVVLRGGAKDLATGGEAKPEPLARTPEATASVEVDNAGTDAQMEVEILRREAERIKVELDQRLALNNSILLKVRTEREAFKAERQAAQREDQAEVALRRDVGFEKQVAIIESLAPKIAVQHLLGMSDPDEAAKILMAIETGKARKIVEGARRGDELTRMQVILQRVRDAAPNRSAELDPSVLEPTER